MPALRPQVLIVSTARCCAEHMALSLLGAIEAAGFIKAGRTEREIEHDIRALVMRGC